MSTSQAIRIFRTRGTIPPGHGDTIARYLEARRDEA